MKSFLLFAFVLVGMLPLGAARAQSRPPTPRQATVLDLTGAAGPTLNYASAAAWRLWGLDAAGRLQVGVGLRASHFFAAGYDLDRQTEPDGPGVRVPSPNLTSLNAAFHLRARVAGPVRLGFNLDAAGLTLGPERPQATATGPGSPPAEVPLRPVRGNLLLGGRRDLGSLNSEFYAAVALSRGLSLRVGYSHIVTAYASETDRYRRFRNLAALGLSYQLP